MGRRLIKARIAEPLVLLVLLSAGPAAAQRGAIAPAATPRRNAIVPVVAAHQHLMSREAWALIAPIPSQPTIALPAELERLLRRREQVAGAPPGGDLFSEDAMIQDAQTGRWQRGPARIDLVLGSMARDVHYVPNAFAIDASAGYIAGTVRFDSGAAEKLNFVLGLRRRADGAWQIATEVFTVIPPLEYAAPVTADELVEQLDDAGIQRGVVLSVGYWFGDPRRQIPVADAAAKTRAENDWTIAEVSRHPRRLVAFCGVNPMAEYAIAEVERCATIPLVKGMKVHFGNSGVDVKNPEHVEKLRRFFQAANARRMPIVAHLRQRGGYTREHAQIILDRILSLAPDVPIQIAHMGSAVSEPDEATAVFANAIVAGDPRTRRVSFDITQTVLPDGSQSAETLARIAATLRRVGLERIYFGTDMIVGTNPPPREQWKVVRRLPLTDAELWRIARNVPAYLR
jgi:predicted TIM-barrel fold metal-dependent hydrolase